MVADLLEMHYRVVTLLLTGAVAALASILITPVVVRAARGWDLFDVPDEGRRIHTEPIPRVGGVAVCAAMIAGLLVAGAWGLWRVTLAPEQVRFFLGILLGSGIMFLAGLWDDVRGLSPVSKLAAQCAAAVVVFALGFRFDVIGIGPTELALGVLALPLTVLWVVGVTNAFNLIDGLDGLATGIGIVALGTTLAAALALNNPLVAVACAALLGALLGFLRYNFNPARVFLGDSGSLFVGFMLAVLSVHGSLKSATAVLIIVPLFALALPLLDTGLAILRRWLRGMPLSTADSRHIHHRLLAVGFSHRRATLVMYCVAGLLASLGVLLTFAPPTFVLLIALAGGGLMSAVLVYGMRRLDYHEFSVAGAVLAQGFLRTRRIIQDQIYARELASLIPAIRSLREMNDLLEEHAVRFGFLGMEVCRETAPSRSRIALLNGLAPRAWKLEFPVTPRASLNDDPYVLRVWSDPGGVYRPYGAERVARILAPAIEGWLTAGGAQEPVVVRRLPTPPARPAIM